MAHAGGLPVHDKPDSTGICFIGERPFQEFLGRYLRTDPGPIETDAGRVVGEHRGLALYTLGQRSGLGIGGRGGSAAAPWYVADKDAARNALIVVQDHESSAAAIGVVRRRSPALVGSPEDLRRRIRCGVKTRYRQADLDCEVRLTETRGARAA